MRPGEKLYEELFDRNEKPVSTDCPGIMAAIPQPIEPSLLNRTIENLEVLAKSGDEKGIIQKLASIVPGYDEDHYDDQSMLAKNMKGLKDKQKELDMNAEVTIAAVQDEEIDATGEKSGKS